MLNSPKAEIISDSRSSSRQIITAILQILGFAAFTAVLSKGHIYLPFSPVPITLQTLGVCLAGAMLGSRKGALSQLTLIGMGASGLPVFSGAAPGYLSLIGPTGGYIWGFVLVAFMTGLLFENLRPRNLVAIFVLLFTGSLFVFIPGIAWLMFLTHLSLPAALKAGFIPFLVGDLLKTLTASVFLAGYFRVRAK